MYNHKKFIIPVALALSLCALTVYSYSETGYIIRPTRNMAMQALNAPETVAEIATPELTVSEIAIPSRDKIIAEHTTSYKGGNKGRITNIKHAAEKIDGKIVQPGEIFSFNDTVGPTTKKNGFALARIFVRGKDSQGYGGGVCQVSSTLFNAAHKAGLKVTERHNHSKPVGYVAKGMDAATSYGVIDFKFENNTTTPIKINSITDGEEITIQLRESTEEELPHQLRNKP